MSKEKPVNTTWEEINDIVHDIKNSLMKVCKIEMACKNLRKTIEKEMERLNDIILNQVDNEGNKETN